MGTRPRPQHAITATDEYLALILDELEEQGEALRQAVGLLAEIGDRLPAKPVASEQQEVPVKVDIREPATDDPPAGTAEPIELAEPAPPRKRTPAKKTAAKVAKPSS